MVKLEVLGVHNDGQQRHAWVLLRHEDRVLPIVVGEHEAGAIHEALIHRNVGRPMTHDLICNLLAGLRGQLKSLVIYKLENDTFYAHLNIEQMNASGAVEQVLRVDSRPSDGIAVALRVDSPIYAAEAVMDQAAQPLAILGSSEEGPSDEGDDADPDEPEFEE
ncbi:MAG: bifunctional nuclease family protein [Candidatus Hydrogenedentes bacterium]|nr:bifunctional nuclease family protein [Candidatus Hydrogenedentota bacterium]